VRAAPDLGQHVVEGVDQHADLAAFLARHAQAEVAPLHHLARDVGDRLERPRDRFLQARGDQPGDHQRAQHHRAEDGAVAEQALDRP
jgi:hypothetical protein